MNKLTSEQLQKCIYADLNNFNSETNTYFIKKYSKPQYLPGHCYLVKLPREIINNSTTLLAINWNNGNAPQHEYYKAYVTKMVGKMAYVDCRAFNFETKQDIPAMWSGYLDIDTLNQIGEIR